MSSLEVLVIDEHGLPSTLPWMSALIRAGSVNMFRTFCSTTSGGSESKITLPMDFPPWPGHRCRLAQV